MESWQAVSLFRDLSLSVNMPENFAAGWGTMHFPSFCNLVMQSESRILVTWHGSCSATEPDKCRIAQSQFLGMTY